METKNYDWKNIVFEIRDLIVNDGYKELFHISNVMNSLRFDEFSLYRSIKNEEDNHVIMFLHAPVLSEAEYKPYNDRFSTSVLLIPIEYDSTDYITNFIIDRWKICLNRNQNDIDHLEYLKNVYDKNNVNIRFVISILHEIGHAFEDCDIDENEDELLIKEQLNFHELNYRYHQKADETSADVLAIETLYRHGEEILKIILDNKTENNMLKPAIAMSLAPMFSSIHMINDSLFDEAKSENNINK